MTISVIYRLLQSAQSVVKSSVQIKPPKSLTENQRKAILEFAKDEDFSGSVNEEPGDESLLAKAKNKFNS